MNEAARARLDGAHDTADPELETGEPIPDEPAPGPKKIRAGGFTGRGPSRPVEPDRQRSEGGGAPTPAHGGQMVLSTAKYLPAEPSAGQQPSAHLRGEQAEAEKSTARGMWTGSLMMAVAVIWFGAGLATDTIYFFPPVLFVAGVMTFIKGDKAG